MASTLRFLDSFAHYTTAQGARKWSGWGGSAIVASLGRWGGSALDNTGSAGVLTLPTAGLFTAVAGAAYKITGSFGNYIHSFTSPTLPGASGSAGIALMHVGDGRLQVVLGNGARPITPISSFIMHQDTFYHIELAVMVGHFSGTDQIQATVYVNGVQILTGFRAVTPYTDYAITQYTVIGGGIATLWSDLYITGSETTGDTALVYGDTAVFVQRPASDQGTNAWVPSSGSAHCAMVDDTTPDDAATMLTDAGVGTIDLHGLSAVTVTPNSPAILGTQFLVCADKDGAGTAEYAHVYHEGGSDYLDPAGGLYNPSAGSWLYSREVQETNPDGSGAWTVAALNALAFGVKRTA